MSAQCKLFIYKGQPLVLKEVSPTITIYAPVVHQELKEEPCPIFDVGKIPLSLWRTIASFFRKVHQEEKSEAQVRLFYSDTTRQWKACAFPQEKNSGMTTKELKDHEDYGALMSEMLEGGLYYQWGTIHSHCDVSAFQSGTDKSDEESSPGIHITIGKIISDKIDLHVRFTMIIPGDVTVDAEGNETATKAQTFFCPVKLSDFIDIPDLYVGESAPQEIKDFAFSHLISLNTEDLSDPELIEKWMKSRIEKPKAEISFMSYDTHGNSYSGSWSKWGDSAKAEWDKWKSRYYTPPSNGKKKKSKSKKQVALWRAGDNEVLLPIVEQICRKNGISKYKLKSVLEMPDHKVTEYKDTLTLGDVHREITNVFGVSKATLVKMLDDWLEGPGTSIEMHQTLLGWPE